MNQRKGAALIAALALGYAGSAAAEQETGFYAGIGVGQSTVEVDDIDFDDDDTGFKLFGGYQINRFFAVELAYINGGKTEASIPDDGTLVGAPIVVLPGTVSTLVVDTELETTQVNVSAVGSYAFNDFFGVMGRLGFSYVDAEVKFSERGLTAEGDDTTTDFAYGVGAWFAPTNNFALRLEYEMTQAEFDDLEVDLSLITLSAVYRFGR